MNPTIEISEVDRVPADARVCDYDELTGEATHALPDAVENGTATVRWRTAEQFAGIDVVRYTAYYRVTITDLQESQEERTATTDATDAAEPHAVTQRSGVSTPDEPLPEY